MYMTCIWSGNNFWSYPCELQHRYDDDHNHKRQETEQRPGATGSSKLTERTDYILITVSTLNTHGGMHSEYFGFPLDRDL